MTDQTGNEQTTSWIITRTGRLCTGICYADHLVILAAGVDSRTLSERIQEGMDVVNNWCQTTGLTLSARKATAKTYLEILSSTLSWRRNQIGGKCVLPSSHTERQAELDTAHQK